MALPATTDTYKNLQLAEERKEATPRRVKVIMQRLYDDIVRFAGSNEVIASQTAADPLLNAYSAERRNIWLAKHLLQDGNGKALAFDEQPKVVREAAIEAASDLLTEVGLVPFGWVMQAAALLASTAT